jgi:hypothetical protein
MKEGSKVSKVLAMMDFDTPEENLDLLIKTFGDIKKVSQKTGRNLVQELVSRKYDEDDCLMAIRTLLIKGDLSANHVDKYGRNFIQIAINTGYSDKFICKCINLGIVKGIDLNHKDNQGNNILHTMAIAANYQGDFMSIIFHLYGKININEKNNDLRDFKVLILESNKYTTEYKRELLNNVDKLYWKMEKMHKRRNG